MGRCKYGQPIRTRLQEAWEEERRRGEERRALLFEGGEAEEDDDGGEEDEDGETEEDDDGGEAEEDDDGGEEDEDGETEEDEDGATDERGEEEGDEGEESKASDSHWWIPSPLMPLKGTAVEPKVGNHRVVFAKGTNRGGGRSDMTMWDLCRLARRFPWPKGVELRLPCATGGYLAKYPGCVVVYEPALYAGFRLPLHPFIRDFLALENYCPAQLTPTSWRYILAFLLKFKELNLSPSYEAFKSFCETESSYDIHTVNVDSINLISTPVGVTSWRKRWFLVRQSEVFFFNFPMYPGDHRWGKGYTMKKDDKDQDRVKKFLKSLSDSVPSYKRVITEHRLEKAGLSLPHPVKESSIRKRYISKRKRQVISYTPYRPDLKKMEDLSKKVKTSLSPFTSIRVGRESVGVVHEEEEEEEQLHDEDEEEEEEEDEDPQEVEEDEDKEEEPQEEEEEEKEDLASIGPQERPIEPAPINSTRHLNGEKEVCEEGGIDVPLEGGRLSSFPPASEWINSISTLSRPEVSTALRQLPELILAAQRSEQLERELDESRKEIVELRGEKVELKCKIDELRRRGMLLADALATKERELATKERDFQSQIERMELEKKTAEDRLIQTVQKATELLEIVKIKL